jgi:hypothetical protein
MKIISETFVLFTISLLLMTAGCSTLAGSSPESTPTPEPTVTEIPTPEPVVTETPTPTPTETETQTPEHTPMETESDLLAERRQRYAAFNETYRFLLRDTGTEVMILDSQAYPKNETYHLTYQLNASMNHSEKVAIRRDVAISYIVVADSWNTDEYPDKDHTWLPDTVCLTSVTADGTVYGHNYIRYNWAFKYNEGLWSSLVYMGHYGGTLEKGPADPDYGSNETGADPDYPEPYDSVCRGT